MTRLGTIPESFILSAKQVKIIVIDLKVKWLVTGVRLFNRAQGKFGEHVLEVKVWILRPAQQPGSYIGDRFPQHFVTCERGGGGGGGGGVEPHTQRLTACGYITNLITH